jgi:hypothetical protein
MHLVVKGLCPNTVEQQMHPAYRVNEKGYVNLRCKSPSGAIWGQHMVRPHHRKIPYQKNPHGRHKSYTLTAAFPYHADCTEPQSAENEGLRDSIFKTDMFLEHRQTSRFPPFHYLPMCTTTVVQRNAPMKF